MLATLLDPATAHTTLGGMPRGGPGAKPMQLAAAPDGSLWYT